MSYELYLRHYSRAGVLKNAVLAPLWARYTESVSGQEPLVFGLDRDHPQVDDLAEFDILEVMLRNRELGLADFERAFVGILRHWSRAMDDDGLEVITFTAPNEKHILSWRHVLWYAGVADRSDFQAVAAETIMKTVVQYNLTSLATMANGRQREGDLATAMSVNVTIDTDTAGGNVLSLAFMGANVLDVLAKVAEAGGGDFSLVWQGGTVWTFAFHAGQLGADKSSGPDRVLFSVEPGNNTMLRPRLKRTGAAATTAISGGQGIGIARDVSAVDGPDYAASMDMETFVDARGEPTAEGRELRGGLALEQMRVREELTFDVLQTANQFYSPIPVIGRKTYRAGDLVLASFGGEHVRKIESVEARWEAPNRGDAFTVSVTSREVSDA